MRRRDRSSGLAVVNAATITLDRSSATPLFRQLYDSLRASILRGHLPRGTRLPSTRALAADLAIARNTVASAYDQLVAEGYLEGQVGSGTYVARTLPDDAIAVGAEVEARREPCSGRQLSRRGDLLAATPVAASQTSAMPRPFRAGLPAFDAFPFQLWARLMTRHWRRPSRELLGYGAPAGYRPLREAIAAQLAATRGVRCDAEQVLIVAGSQQALDLASRVLLDEGDVVWIEDPGYLGARGALVAAGARVVGVPVDAEGIDVAWGTAHAPTPRLVYVSPSYQYPLGVTMSLARRLALLDWASRADAWVLEDDCDSEYRYTGRPLAALQGLDRDGRVIYLGTFSKVLLPSLRLGYLVVPPDRVDAFAAARALVDRHSPLVEQAVLADFIHDGHFAHHVRRTRLLYAERQATLVEAASRELSGLLDVRPADAGLHLIGWLPEGVDDVAAASLADARDVETIPLSRYYLQPAPRGGLVLGYAALNEEQIRDGVSRLAQALQRTPGVRKLAPPRHPE